MARHSSGWIKLHRSVADSDIGTNGFCLAIWARLLLMATREDSTIRWNGKPRKIPPGCVVIGIRKLADGLGFSKDTISKWLKYLRDRDTVQTEAATEGTLVTIKNWDGYQGSDVEAPTPSPTPHRHGAAIAQDATPPPNGEVRSKKNTYRRKIEYPSDFEALWEILPEGGKKAALDAYLKHSPEDRALIPKAAAAYVADCRARNKFTKNLSTLLNDDWRVWLTPKAPRRVFLTPEQIRQREEAFNGGEAASA